MAELVNNKMPVAVHICQFFQRTGTCKFGDSCRFSHDVSPRHAPRPLPADGWTAMHQAAWAGDTRTLARLLVSQLQLAQVSAR